jgi:hypothetical protein
LEALEETLRSLLEGLDQSYERILLNVNPRYFPLTMKALHWLAVSRRPLSIAELAEATSITPELPQGQRIVAKRQLSDPRDILLLRSSLITISQRYTKHADEYQWGEENWRERIVVEEVQLAHFSVKEYPLSYHADALPGIPKALTEQSCHRYVAEACLAYLLQYDNVDSLKYYSYKTFPLATYAARYWC